MSAIDLAKVQENSRPLEALNSRIVSIIGIAGFTILTVSFFISVFTTELQQFMFSYLTNFCYFMSISLGALFFVILQHLTRAGWSVVVRRIAEILSANVMVLVILFIPVIFGMSQLYIWTQSDIVQADHLLQHKFPYLNVPFFLIRIVFYFTVWILYAWFYLDRSLKQDESGDTELTLRMEARSPVGMILFALSLTFFSIDAMMSLDPHWFSTIFGVYYFAGSVIGFLSALSISTFYLQSSGRLDHIVNKEHFHDIGKLLFGFVVFWAYIAFSQFMLIWYANMPEETLWYLHRQEGSWAYVSIFLIFAHFVIPFFGLLSRHIKRNRLILVFWAVWMLVVHWVDIYWVIMPNFSHHGVHFHYFDVLCLLGIGGLYIASAAKLASGKSLVPLKDPRLTESLQFHNF